MAAPAEFDREYLWQLFQQTDLEQRGSVSPAELQTLLQYGSWELDLDTCRLLVAMFDHEGTGRVTFQDFSALWRLVTDWQTCFNRFDKDGSGAIDNYRLLTALGSFGFRLPLRTVNIIVKRYERDEEGSIYFDDFIRCCATVHNVTKGFKKRDPEHKGEIAIKYEDLIELVFSAGL